ncbi:hypothetical protein P12x_002863 [Tundrisphaera lichenicola]|uniref:hypothetical protein n=1 Tax=Tundrisphaera lichenicola TaxID=2029860 RepID=UPI003EC0B549
MAWFQCSIRGEQFPGALAGVSGLVGFFTTRFVEAADAGDAETLALTGLRDEPRLKPLAGDQAAGMARIYFEQIAELPRDSAPAQQPGFTWYPMETDA